MPNTTLSRRSLLRLSAGAPLALSGASAAAQDAAAPRGPISDWNAVRDLFKLSPDMIHMSAMLITAHPAPVREAIDRHRSALDTDPVEYLETNGDRLTEDSRRAAAAYLGVDASHVALTDSTTMGLGLVYNGIDLREGQEVLTTEQDYYSTHYGLRYATGRSGAKMRKIALHDGASGADAEQMVKRIVDAIRPETRLLALTWVHSNTGLKMPVAAISAALEEINAGRDDADRVLFGLDGVHGFGIESDSFPDLGVDFLMAGCHKWLFGPRGTGIAAISARGLAATSPVIPSFDDSTAFSNWYTGRGPEGDNSGPRMTPGGFKPFEHRWALAEAFALHDEIGRDSIAERTHRLAGSLKEALGKIGGVTVHTPREAALSSGIVAFEVDGLSSQEVVNRLRERAVVASVAPYPSSYVRLTPSIRNTEQEVEKAAAALSDSI